MDLTEQELSEFLGVQQEPSQEPENKPDNGPDVSTEPAPDTPEGNGGGIPPEGGEMRGTAPDGHEPPPAEPAQAQAEPAQTPPQFDPAVIQETVSRAVQEAVRRAEEQQKARYDQQLALIFRQAGLHDPETGKSITTMEEFEAYQRAEQTRQLGRNLREGKLTPEDLEALIRRTAQAQPPQAQSQAQQLQPLQQIQAQQPQTQPFTPSPQFQAQIDREIQAIHQLDGRVNSLEDLLKLDTAPRFRQAVDQGCSFLDAYKLANFDALQARQRELSQKAAQAAVNNARSKEHLQTSASKGDGSVPVPGDVLNLYHQLMPDAKDSDILAHYNRMLREEKGA